MNYQDIETIIKSNLLTEEEKINLIFENSLPNQLKILFKLLPIGKENALSCKDLNILTRFETKNISSQLKILIKRNNKICYFKINQKFKYYINN